MQIYRVIDYYLLQVKVTNNIQTNTVNFQLKFMYFIHKSHTQPNTGIHTYSPLHSLFERPHNHVLLNTQQCQFHYSNS